MEWTDRQIAQGKAELLRRKTFETAATYRKSFFTAFCWCIVCLITIILALLEVAKATNWMTRSSMLCLICVALFGLAITGAPAYVRLLDWRRSYRRESDDCFVDE
jgi:membrane protein YdbS with pleckstrin-like domain